jgi:hypothetical protein
VKRALVVIVLAPVLLSACVHSETKPPKPLRTPRSVSDVTGIWRTVHQNTFELRRNGTYVLVTSVSKALAGDYTLEQDHITVSNNDLCGGASGTYRIQVSPEEQLVLSEPDDACTLRRTQLTADPFVYAS